MDMPEPHAAQNTNWWITSLAISVVCCAVLFVIFAGYLVEIKEGIAVTKIRMDLAEQRLNEMNSEVEALRRHTMVQQIQILPAPGGSAVQVPTAALPQIMDTSPAMAAPTAPNAPAASPGSAAVQAPPATPSSQAPEAPKP